MRARLIAGLVVLLTFSLGHALAAEAPRSQIVFGAGVNGIWPHSGTSRETNGIASVEYRFGAEFWRMSPLVGLQLTTDGDVYAHVGVYHDFTFGNRWIVTPHVSIGAYGHNRGNNLGSGMEFQVGADVFYRLDSGWRIGATLRHLSNAGTGHFNPGTEMFMILLSMPLR